MSAATTTTNDLDVDEILKWFGSPHVNTGVAEDDAVRVLEDFKKAQEPTALPASGEQVWFGKTYNVNTDGTSGEGFVFVRLKRDGGGVVGYAAGLTPESGNEDGDARRLFKAVSKAGAPDADSESLKYVKTARPEHAYAPLGASDGKSKILADDAPPRYLRQLGARLLLVQGLPRHVTEKQQPLRGTGRYAELWKLP